MKRDLVDVLMEIILPGTVVLLVSVLLVAGVIGATDAVQSYRAYPASVGCEQHRMEARRRAMSARVTCVPVNTRQDTTTVNLNGRP